jgi:glycosyltransferase involved in cell wall biosynthesis
LVAAEVGGQFMARVVSVSAGKPSREYAGHRVYARHLAAIAQKNHVTVLTVDTQPNSIHLPNVDILQVVPAYSIFHAAPPKVKRLFFIRAQLLNGLSMGMGVRKSIRAEPFATLFRDADVVELQWAQALSLARDVRSLSPRTHIVAIFQDVLNDPYRTVVRRGSKVRHALLSFLAAQERRAEIKALRYLDAAIVLSQKDAELLAGLGFTGSVLVESPPIEVAHVVPPVHQGKTVLFSGHFGRLENSGGAKWLIDRVWPDVLRQEPEARLVIAGSSPPKWLYDLGNEGVKITGWVSDLNEYYAGARVFAASLLSGAGVKLKVLEAMAHNVPVVATPVAADGIVDVIGSDCFVGISDDPTAFAKYLVVALQDDEICRRVASQAAQQIERKYSFESDVGKIAMYYSQSA